LKEGNDELVQAENHQVLNNSHDVISNCIIEEVPDHKSNATDTDDKKIVITDEERKINDEDVQAR